MADDQASVPKVPDCVWLFASAAGDEPSARRHLMGLDRRELASLFRAYVEARTELADRLAAPQRGLRADEDLLDELAEFALLRGPAAYASAFIGDDALPPRDEWDTLLGVIHVFDEVFTERFGADIFDTLDE